MFISIWLILLFTREEGNDVLQQLGVVLAREAQLPQAARALLLQLVVQHATFHIYMACDMMTTIPFREQRRNDDDIHILRAMAKTGDRRSEISRDRGYTLDAVHLPWRVDSLMGAGFGDLGL